MHDWALEVLRLRGTLDSESGTSLLSHRAPFSKRTLRKHYWAVAKAVHPDRLHVGSEVATQAMSVLNEAYRSAVLHFAERDVRNEVIRLDAHGLEHYV